MENKSIINIDELNNEQLQILQQQILVKQMSQLVTDVKDIKEKINNINQKINDTDKRVDEINDVIDEHLCITPSQKRELHKIKDEKINYYSKMHNIPKSRHLYRDFWSHVNNACNVSTMECIPMSKFEIAKESAENWVPYFLR